MTTLEIPSETSAPMWPAKPEAAELLNLQLQVARRADALARRSLETTREADRRVWLRAELEIFERTENVA